MPCSGSTNVRLARSVPAHKCTSQHCDEEGGQYTRKTGANPANNRRKSARIDSVYGQASRMMTINAPEASYLEPSPHLIHPLKNTLKRAKGSPVRSAPQALRAGLGLLLEVASAATRRISV